MMSLFWTYSAYADDSISRLSVSPSERGNREISKSRHSFTHTIEF